MAYLDFLTLMKTLSLPLQDWKDHQHTCCQSAGGVTAADDESIVAIEMDKVK